MIPFARIVKYGNVLKNVGMKQISTIGLGHMFLTQDGELYVYGKDTYGRFGSGFKGTDDITSLKLIRSDVQNMWNTLSYTIILTTDGKYMASGLLVSYGVPDSTVFVDISSLFAQVPNISQLVVDAATSTSYAGMMAVLDTNGDCWMVGANSRYQFGNNTATPSIGVFLKIMSGVKEIVGNHSGVSWCFLKNDNTLYTTGGNVFTSGAENRTPLLLASGVLKAVMIAGRGVMYVKGDKKLYTRGYMVGAYGSTSTDVKEAAITTTPFVYNYDTDIIRYDPFSQVYAGTIILWNVATQKWYTGGTLGMNRMGTTVSSGGGWYEMRGDLPAPNDVLFVSGGSYNSNIISSPDGAMHTCGAYNGNGTLPGSQLVNYPAGYQTSTEYIISRFAV